jgi:TPR repeat protein
MSDDPKTNFELYKKNAPKYNVNFHDFVTRIEMEDHKIRTTINFFSNKWKSLKAMRYLKKAAEQGLPEAQYELALNCYMTYDLGNIKEGNKWLLKAAQNGNIKAMKDLGFLLMEAGAYSVYFPQDHNKAFEWFKKAADKGNTDAQLLQAYLLSLGKGTAKDIKQAEELYKKAAQKKPAKAYNDLAWMLAEEGIRLDEAEKMAKEALSHEPDNPCILDTLGWIYYKQKKYKMAKEKIAEAAKIDQNPVIMDHLGDIHFALGEKTDAHTQWKEALKTCNDHDLIKSINTKLAKLNKPQK